MYIYFFFNVIITRDPLLPPFLFSLPFFFSPLFLSILLSRSEHCTAPGIVSRGNSSGRPFSHRRPVFAFHAHAFYSDVLIVGQFRGEGTGPDGSSTHESRGGGPPSGTVDISTRSKSRMPARRSSWHGRVGIVWTTARETEERTGEEGEGLIQFTPLS